MAPSPATLFVEFWREAAALPPSERSLADVVDEAFLTTARSMALLDDGESAYEGLKALVSSRAERVGPLLGVMTAIDHAFSHVHPRTLLLGKARAALPSWMKALRDDRMVTGAFVTDDELRLIPRGPLLRLARDPAASSADSLADRFAYLTCAPVEVREKGRKIPVTMQYIGMDLLQGVEPISSPGRERIAFIPVAELGDDLEIASSTRGEKVFANYRPAAGLPCADRVVAALANVGEADLALAPELVMNPEQSDMLLKLISTMSGAPKLLLSGSYNTDQKAKGQPFNEAELANSMGTRLWQQRKLWPASISASDAHTLGLKTAPPDKAVFEDNASGNDLVMTDIDGFGRVIVLICQDLKLDVALELVEAYQPDWVLVPILDHGFAVGRWAHSRAFTLSQNAQSRFVAVTSSSLAYRLGKALPATIGMAVGPALTEGPDETERAHAFVLADPSTTPACGIVTWREGDTWQVTNLGAADAR